MSAATPAQAQAMANAIGYVRRTYAAASDRLHGWNGVLPGVFRTPAQDAVVSTLGRTHEQIEDWANRMLGWALRGEREDRSSYDTARFLAHGETLAQTCAQLAGIGLESSYFRVVRDTVTKSVTDVNKAVAKVADVSLWPLEWKIAAVLVVSGVVLYGLSPYVPLVRAMVKGAAK